MKYDADVVYPDEDNIGTLPKGFKLAAEGYLSKSKLLYVLDTVQDLYNKEKLEEDLLVAKTSFLMFQIISSHPFIDGNKRTAYGTADVFLRLNGYCIRAEPDDALQFILSVATGESDEPTVRKWVRQHLKKL